MSWLEGLPKSILCFCCLHIKPIIYANRVVITAAKLAHTARRTMQFSYYTICNVHTVLLMISTSATSVRITEKNRKAILSLKQERQDNCVKPGGGFSTAHELPSSFYCKATNVKAQRNNRKLYQINMRSVLIIIITRRHADYLYANGCRRHSSIIMLMWTLKDAITGTQFYTTYSTTTKKSSVYCCHLVL